MRFDFFKEFFQKLGLNPRTEKIIQELYITYFSSFIPVSDDTKIKPGDFYDQKNKVYYVVKKTGDGVYLIPNLDKIDISKNTVSMFVNYSGAQIFTISHENLVKEIFIFCIDFVYQYVKLFTTNYYDSDSLNYILENNLLPNYEKFVELSINLQKKKLEPDISYNFDSKNDFIEKRIYDMFGNIDINVEFPVRVQQYKFACDLDNSIKKYKQKVKSIFPEGE